MAIPQRPRVNDNGWQEECLYPSSTHRTFAMLLQKTITLAIQKWTVHVRDHINVPLRLVLPDGESYDFGKFSHPKVIIKPRDLSVFAKLSGGGLDALGEAYVKGQIDVDGHIDDIIEVAYQIASVPAAEPSALAKLLGTTHRYLHSKEEDLAAIAYHYDVSNLFYSRWLDTCMVYSCAYFPNGDEDLDTAQQAKIDHVLTKIRLQPGQTLLDIGCGWGALVIRAAAKFGARCVGITLSEQQFEYATARVRALGLSERVEIRRQDYRDVTGEFDRITSVGMFEHVGLNNLPAYFTKVASLLRNDGVAMNHGITSTRHDGGSTPYGGGNFIDKYVFPKGELPHLSLAIQAMQQGGLEVLDVENLRRHYARTLRLWSQRFEANSHELRREVGEKRFRIWRVYLAACAHAFEIDNIAIFQMVSGKAGMKAAQLPWNRQYMYPLAGTASQPARQAKLAWTIASDHLPDASGS
jgi:cyclopropane-fatty-acyl-phospholipid synthase